MPSAGINIINLLSASTGPYLGRGKWCGRPGWQNPRGKKRGAKKRHFKLKKGISIKKKQISTIKNFISLSQISVIATNVII
jgi:hypothetical protein